MCLVAGAAADVAGDRLADLRLVGAGSSRRNARRGHQDARRAEPALQGVVLAERLLQRVRSSPLGEALDGRDLGAVGLDGEHQARADRPAVDDHRAGAADAVLAAEVGPGEPEASRRKSASSHAHLGVARAPLAVDDERDGAPRPAHAATLGLERSYAC